jgi:hypothetical protein
MGPPSYSLSNALRAVVFALDQGPRVPSIDDFLRRLPATKLPEWGAVEVIFLVKRKETKGNGEQEKRRAGETASRRNGEQKRRQSRRRQSRRSGRAGDGRAGEAAEQEKRREQENWREQENGEQGNGEQKGRRRRSAGARPGAVPRDKLHAHPRRSARSQRSGTSAATSDPDERSDV